MRLRDGGRGEIQTGSSLLVPAVPQVSYIEQGYIAEVSILSLV